jgi:hypothetical protein
MKPRLNKRGKFPQSIINATITCIEESQKDSNVPAVEQRM